jgi:undecaprenyl diphosphate synthase
MMDIIKRLYVKKLERSVSRGKIPRHVMIVSDDVFLRDRLEEFTEWCSRFGIEEVTICIRCNEKRIESHRMKNVKVNVVLGYSGREELVDAIKVLAELVERGELNPDDVDESLVERFLKVKSSPDLIINAGDEIPEFLIWQSIYSELYFADFDVKDFRYIDFLRCLREYQRRERRYGR